MTEAAAWREIARRRTASGRYHKHGLCFQVFELCKEGRLTRAQGKWMLCRIMHAVPINPRTGRERMHAYAGGGPKHTNEGRTLAALWFALDVGYEAKHAHAFVLET